VNVSIGERLKEWRHRYPAKIAVAYGSQSWTYSEFDDETDKLAENLLAAGLRPGDRIAIHLLNGPEIAFLIFGCFKAGCVAVPVNTRLKGREVNYVVQHSGASCYVSEPDLYATVAESCPAIRNIRLRYMATDCCPEAFRPFSDLLVPSKQDQLPTVSSSALALILYTSGTTAEPKGVMHSHSSLWGLAAGMSAMMLDENQVVLIMSSMTHVAAFAAFFVSPLILGATTVITRPMDFDAALDAFARWKVTYSGAFPVVLQGILARQLSAPRDVSSGRTFLCGGDSVSPTLQLAFGEQFQPVCETYGATELVPAIWNGPQPSKTGSLGKPVRGVDVRLVDFEGNDIACGQVGEIWLRGPQVMQGYWQDPDETARALEGGWFHTGDLARQDSDGDYWFAGRKKEIIVHGGSNISPQEIECVLCEHPAVQEAGVVGRSDAIWGESVIAHVALRVGHSATAADLIAFARSRLAEYKVPEAVEFHRELPKGLTGKISRRTLRESYNDVIAKAAQ
jgi:long-chain acyl-CoA synthetase